MAKEQYIKRHDSVCTTTLQHMQGNRVTVLYCTIGQKKTGMNMCQNQ